MANYHNTQRGMTFLELIVVLAIVTILVVAAIPSFLNMKSHLNLQGAAQALVGNLRTTQANAVRQGSTQTLTLAAGQGTYQSFCSTNSNSCVGKDGGGTTQTAMSFNASGYVSAPATLPFTVTLQSAQTGESVKVRVLRTGRMCTFSGTGAATC